MRSKCETHYRSLQHLLVHRPDIGVVIPNSGGLRKMRWSIPGRGKRSGVRIIYFWAVRQNQIPMLLVYSKNEKDDLTPRELRALRRIVEEGVSEMKKELFDDLLQSVREAGAIMQGETVPSRVFDFAPLDVKAIRKKAQQISARICTHDRCEHVKIAKLGTGMLHASWACPGIAKNSKKKSPSICRGIGRVGESTFGKSADFVRATGLKMIYEPKSGASAGAPLFLGTI